MLARARSAALPAAVLAVLTLPSCDEVEGPLPAAESVVGNYDLISVSYPEAPNFFGFATGTMTLTETRYELDVVWHETEVPEPPIRDEGTYRIEGDGVGTWTQESDVTGFTSTGSYQLTNLGIDIDVTIDGVPYVFRWSRL